MKWSVHLCVAMFLVAPAFADDKGSSDKVKDQKAVDILKKADEATKAVKSVRYHAKFELTGWMQNFGSTVEGDAVLAGGFSGGGIEKFRYDLEMSRGESAEKIKMSIGANGEEFYIFDHSKKTALVDIDPSFVFASAPRGAMGLGMAEYVHPTPFSDEINGDEIELKGKTKIGDEECYQIHVVYSGGQGEAIWYFSTKDHLPRRVERIRPNPQNADDKGMMRHTLTKLTVDPKFVDDPFKVKVPDGYEMIEE